MRFKYFFEGEKILRKYCNLFVSLQFVLKFSFVVVRKINFLGKAFAGGEGGNQGFFKENILVQKYNCPSYRVSKVWSKPYIL